MFKDSPEGQTQYEPAAPEPLGDSEGTATQVVAGLEPVAWRYALVLDGKELDVKCSTTNLDPVYHPFGRAGIDYNELAIIVKTKLCLAATVERLVQERDQWKQLAANCELAEEQVSSSYQLTAMTQERDVLLTNLKMQNWGNTQLAAMTQELNRLKDTNWYLNGIKDERLAASQAREQQLREALETLKSCTATEGQYGRAIQKTISNVLSLPQDDTALRQWGAKLLREMADEYAQGAKDADKDSRVFLSEANARCAIHLRRKSDELERGKK